MPEIEERKRAQDIGKGDSCQCYIWHACITCGKERWVILNVGKGKPCNLRCRKCAPLMRGARPRGAKANRWKGGHYKDQQGYAHILLQPDDFYYSMTDKGGYVLEHRLVMAKHLGRCLHLWEIVHHKGIRYRGIENKSDNLIGNLQLVTDDRHRQITILENKIKSLEGRVTLLEAENTLQVRKVDELYKLISGLEVKDGNTSNKT